MDQPGKDQRTSPSMFCCCGHAEERSELPGLSRREFISATGAATALGLGLPALMTGALATIGPPGASVAGLRR